VGFLTIRPAGVTDSSVSNQHTCGRAL
jgi:hypothetical protein